MPLTYISYHLHMCALLWFFKLSFTIAHFLLLDNKFVCHMQMHAILSGLFLCLVCEVASLCDMLTSLVVLQTLLGGAELPVSVGTWPQ